MTIIPAVIGGFAFGAQGEELVNYALGEAVGRPLHILIFKGTVSFELAPITNTKERISP
jgi:hypothetical protein